MNHIFISYAREDKDFVRTLTISLKQRERESWVDWRNIPPTAQWREEIFAAIESAEAFVFVISPDSVSSPVCQEELEHASRQCKRLIPLVRREVVASSVPEELQSINWIFFRKQKDFAASCEKLLEAVDADLDWVHAHTQLLTRALEWKDKGRPRSLVLRGKELQTARRWLETGEEKDPPLTVTQRSFINESLHSASLRRRALLGGISFVLVLTLILSLTAYFQHRLADQRRNLAKIRQLTAHSQLLLDDRPDRFPTSVLLSVESMRRSLEMRIPSLESDQSLRGVLRFLIPSSVVVRHQSSVRALAFTPDGRRLAAVGGPWAAIWEVAAGEPVMRLAHDGQYLQAIAVSSDGRLLATSGVDSRIGRTWHISVWDLVSGEMIQQSKSGLEVREMSFTADGLSLVIRNGVQTRIWDFLKKNDPEPYTGSFASKREISAGKAPVDPAHLEFFAFAEKRNLLAAAVPTKGVSGASSPVVRVWNTMTGRELFRAAHEERIPAMVFSPAGRYLATGDEGGTVKVWEVPRDLPLERTFTANALASHNEQHFLASGVGSREVTLWDLDLQVPLRSWTLSEAACAVVLSPEGDILAAGAGKNLYLWDTGTGELLGRRQHDENILAVTVGSEGGRVVAAGMNRFSIWKGSSLVERHSYTAAKPGYALPCSLRNQEKRDSGVIYISPVRVELELVSGERYLKIFRSGEEIEHVWNLKSGRELVVADSASFSKDGSTLLVKKGNVLEAWDLASQKRITSLELDFETFHLAISNAGSVLAATGEDQAWAWSRNGNLRLQIAEVGISGPLALDVDGSHLALTKEDSVEIWQVDAQEKIAEMAFDRDLGFSNALAFTADSEYLASSFVDAVHIFSIDEEREIGRFKNPGIVAAVSFSGKNDRFLLARSLETARFQLWRGQDLADEACNRLNMNLDFATWQRYFEDEPYRAVCDEVALDPVEILKQAEAFRLQNREDLAQAYVRRGVAASLKSGRKMVEVCARGAVMGFPEVVLPICDRAVNAELRDPSALGARAMARAFSENYRGAKEDLEALIQQSLRQNQKLTSWEKKEIFEIRSWIKELEGTRNPFDQEALQRFRQ